MANKELTQEELEQIEKELEAREKEVSNLEKLKKDLENNYSKKEEELEQKEKELETREKEVSNLEKLKKDLENNYSKKENELNALKNDLLTGKTKEISSLDKDIAEKKASLDSTNKNLIKKEEELRSKELSFESELSSYKDNKYQQVEKELIAKIDADIKKIEANYEQFLNSSVSTVNWSKDKLEKAFNELNQEFKSLLESKEAIINERKNDLEKTIELYNEEIKKAETLEQDKAKLSIKERQLARKESNLEKVIYDETKKRYQELQDENDSLKEKAENYRQKYIDITKDYEELRANYTSNDYLDKAQLQTEKERLSKKLEEYAKLYKEYSSDEYNELKSKAQKVDAVETEINRLRQDKLKLENQITLLKNESFNNESLKFQNEQLEARIRVERQMMVELQTEIENLSSRIENKKSGIIAAEAIETPVNDFVVLPKSTKERIDENAWLRNIMESCEKSGFKFSKRLYYSFHTSLKTTDMSPLTVLAGVSGTGKSKLPQLYSKFGGLYFLSVPVKPDWDSPQSLFGYFNSIEKRFDATTLLRALVMFQANKSKSNTKDKIVDLSDRVLIVLLDEMNLAHIEQYFSDLLSKLEERRGQNSDVSFEVDLGAGNDKYSIVLTDNVKWVGTMNEDETTKSLSDKVIDRGNVISFPRPETFQRYNHKNEYVQPAEMLERSVWERWVESKVELTEEEADKYMQIVIEINNALKAVNRALGHRVWQSIENYMMSHPLVKEYSNDKDKRELALSYAFEEALVHKVMPKLRGISTDGVEREECLDKIEELLENNELTIVEDFKHAMESVTGTFIWDSAMYLDDDYKKIN